VHWLARSRGRPAAARAGAASASEMKLINVTGIFILLYGVAVASAVALRRALL